MNVSRIYELSPTNRQKSFGGKAQVIVCEDGTEILQSYQTQMVKREPGGRLVRLSNFWSATTGRHIKAFCNCNKAEFQNLPTE